MGLWQLEGGDGGSKEVRVAPMKLNVLCLHAWLLQDPLQRLTIDGIKAHPWFLELLPRNALTLSDRFLAEPMPGKARGE